MDGSSEHPEFRIPGQGLVEKLLLDILKDHVTIRSQTLLHRLIEKRLAESYPDDPFRLSAMRIRRIAAGMDEVRLVIHCRESDRTFKGMRCPVCGSEMANIRNQTLYGWTVNTGKLCDSCGYWTGKRLRVPTRYVFVHDPQRRVDVRSVGGGGT